MSSVSLTSTASPFMDMPMTCRSTATVSLTTCTTSITSRLVDCIGSIWVWMTIDEQSTQAQLVENRSARRLARCTFESIVINGSSILPSKTVRNLGFVLDPSLSLASHVTKLTSTLYTFTYVSCVRSVDQ